MLRYLLIAEDHPICYSALEIAAHARDSAILVEGCETLAETLNLLPRRPYSALVLDLGLKDSKGTINIKMVRDRYPTLPILIVSAADEPDVQARAREFGAQGFLSKSASLDEMGEAILGVMDGGEYFRAGEGWEGATENVLSDISPAQMRVVRELVAGHSNKMIAHRLGVSEATVKSHLYSINKALGTTSRAGVILKLREFL